MDVSKINRRTWNERENKSPNKPRRSTVNINSGLFSKVIFEVKEATLVEENKEWIRNRRSYLNKVPELPNHLHPPPSTELSTMFRKVTVGSSPTKRFASETADRRKSFPASCPVRTTTKPEEEDEKKDPPIEETSIVTYPKDTNYRDMYLSSVRDTSASVSHPLHALPQTLGQRKSFSGTLPVEEYFSRVPLPPLFPTSNPLAADGEFFTFKERPLSGEEDQLFPSKTETATESPGKFRTQSLPQDTAKTADVSDYGSFLNVSGSSGASTPRNSNRAQLSAEKKHVFKSRRSLNVSSVDSRERDSSLDSQGSSKRFSPYGRSFRRTNSPSFNMSMESLSDGESPIKRLRQTIAVDQFVPTYRGFQLLGDSQMVRFSEQLLHMRQYVSFTEDTHSRRLGYCVSGQRIQDLKERLQRRECKLSAKLIILIGTNDFLYKTELSAMKFGMIGILQELKEAEKIVILTVPPVPKCALTEQDHVAKLKEFNSFLSLLAKDRRIRVIDFARLLRDYTSENQGEYYEEFFNKRNSNPKPDLIHLNRDGFKLLRAVIDIKYFEKYY